MRAELAKEFSEVSKNGRVGSEEFFTLFKISILSEVVSNELPWDMLLPYITELDYKGRIHYTSFLSKYVVEGEILFEEVLKKIALNLFNAQQNIEEYFRLIDKNHDGKISFEEFSTALCQEFDLNESRVFDFMLTFDKNQDGYIDLKVSILSR